MTKKRRSSHHKHGGVHKRQTGRGRKKVKVRKKRILKTISNNITKEKEKEDETKKERKKKIKRVKNTKFNQLKKKESKKKQTEFYSRKKQTGFACLERFGFWLEWGFCLRDEIWYHFL